MTIVFWIIATICFMAAFGCDGDEEAPTWVIASAVWIIAANTYG